ncbi:Regulator of chromosome condensation (RCC1) repeat family protein [Acanthocheilonema viteae]
MDTLWKTIAKKYPRLRLDDRFMSGCLLGLIQEDLSRFDCVSDELALQIRVIAMVCVQSQCRAEPALWPPSSLHLTSYYNSVNILEILLEVFGYEESMSFDGSTPAQFAAMKGHLRALVVLFRNQNISIYSCLGGFNAYEFLRSFAKPTESEKLPCLSRIYAYGDNSTMFLGIVHENLITSPVPVHFFDEINFRKEVTQVSFGKYHAIYLIDGQAYSCGLGRYGKLGHGNEKDQLTLREIKFFESIICISAGLTHSIICTQKKIIVFGLNDKGQLGLGTKQLVLTPTVAKFFKESRDYIIACSTAEACSVIVMSNFDFYVTGTANGFLWQRYSGNTFKYVKNNCAYRTSSVLVTDSCMVRIYCNRNISKIAIKVDGKSYYITSTVHVTRCIGVYYAPNLGAVFSGYKCFYESRGQPLTSGIFLFDSECHGLLRSVSFYNSLMRRSIIEVISADITHNGRIIIVDYMGDVYEGTFENYTLFSDPYFGNVCNGSTWVTEYMVKIKVYRLRGIFPAKSAFLAPDGKSKILNLYEIDTRSVHHDTENVSEVEFSSCNEATVICTNEEGHEVARYEFFLEILKHESEVCSSYFERWSGGQNEIRITVKPQIIEIFLDFCYDHCLPPELSIQELTELLIFADKLICKNFFNAIKKELFKPPFEMSKLRQLYALARYLSSVELYKSLSELCAAVFPTLLENGFVNELLLDEIAYIEDAFRSYALDNIVRSVDEFESRITRLVVPEQTVRNIIMDVMEVVKEPMDTKELIDLCRNIKNDLHSVKRWKEIRSAGNAVSVETKCGRQKGSHKKIKNTDTTNKKNENSISEKNDNATNKKSNNAASEKNDNSTNEKSINSTNEKNDNATNEKNDNTVNKKNDNSINGNNTTNKKDDNATNEENDNAVDEKDDNTSNEKNDNSTNEGNVNSNEKDGDTTTNEKNDNDSGRVHTPNILAKIAIAKNQVCEKGIPSLISLSDEGEEKTGESKQEEKKDPCILPSNTSKNPCGSQRETSNSWHLDESVTCENSFAQIMEDEQARQLQTIRQTSSRLSDINIEQQAMVELTAHYESEATIQGVSITVSTEHELEEINDPLWAARSAHQ